MKTQSELVFHSVAALERALDGSDERYEAYFFAIYHCSPDEPAGINERRDQLRKSFPGQVIQTGRHFVLSGEPAFLALAAYYQALAQAETLSEEHRSYAVQRLQEIVAAHKQSQSLPIPIDLTEGQLGSDPKLELLTCVAIENGQVTVAPPS